MTSLQTPALDVLFKAARNVIKRIFSFVISASKDIEKKMIIVNNVVKKTVLFVMKIKMIVNLV